jgi:hypothetical protein
MMARIKPRRYLRVSRPTICSIRSLTVRQYQFTEMKMKKFLAIVALTTSLVSPALAQSWDPDVGSGNIAPPPYGENENGSSIYEHDGSGFSARAEAPRHFATHHRKHVQEQR